MNITTDQPQNTPNITPVKSGERIMSLDITRGVAVLGILLLNIWSFGWPKEIFDYPPILSDLGGATTQTWAVVHIFFEGSQRAIFSILFGAGALMILHRMEHKQLSKKSTRRLYFRRTFFLVIFGLVDAYIFMWPADILYVYGLSGFLLYFMRNMKVRSLLILILFVFSIPTVIRAIEYQQITQLYQSSAPEDIALWQGELDKARPALHDEKIQNSIAIMQEGSLMQVFKKQAVGSLILQTIVTVKWWFIDAFGAMLVGMLLFKTGVLTLQKPKSFYWGLFAIGYGIGIPLSAWETLTLINSDFNPIQQAITAFTYDIGRLSMAFGHLSVILLFCQSRGWGKVKQSLAAVGQMALSNYLAQSIICGMVFYSFGLGLYGELPGYMLYMVVLSLWVIEISWSILWLKRYRFGPFEWLWRTLTYGKAQSMKL